MNIVCVRDTDDLVEAMLLIKSLNADGVFADEPMMKRLEDFKDFITKRPQLNCRVKGPLTGRLKNMFVTDNPSLKLHYLPPTANLTAISEFRGQEKINKPIRVRITHSEGLNCKCFTVIKGGSTGYESVPLCRCFIEKSSQHGWWACAGSHKYAGLFVPATEMKRAHEELNSNVFQNPINGCCNPT